MQTTSILLFLALGLALIAVGALTLRAARRGEHSDSQRAFAWSMTLLGYGMFALVAFAHVTGRFGPERLWFRAPTFYVAAWVLLGGAVFWFRRPASTLQRFGLPAAGVAGLVALALLMRLDGRSAPLAMAMPTLSQSAPALTYTGADGKHHALSELRGKVVLLNFWATWCAPCRHEMPLLSRLQDEHAAAGLVVLYISLEEPRVLDEFLAANRFAGVQGRLDNAASFYDAGKFYPLSYLISRNGRVEKRWSGRPGGTWLDEAIRKELAGS
jgi:cytochrome c biogenesis protein CcmG/thiol:disulfide interchange protein DsbE